MEKIYQQPSQYTAYRSTPGRIYGTEYHVSGNTRSGCGWWKDPGGKTFYRPVPYIDIYNQIGEICASRSS